MELEDLELKKTPMCCNKKMLKINPQLLDSISIENANMWVCIECNNSITITQEVLPGAIISELIED